jgi:hypothetical protein
VFVTLDGGSTIQFQPSTPTLISLPENIRYSILRHVITPSEPIRIDLDTPKRFPNGLLYVNKDIYTMWRQYYLSCNRFSLKMSSIDPITTFSGFKSLAQILRAPINPALSNSPRAIHGGFGDEILEDSMFQPQKIHIELNFELAEPVAPCTLRIAILPLVLETSSTPGMEGAYIVIKYPESRHGEVVQAKQRIYLKTLRFNVVQALGDFLQWHSNSANLRQPGIWIDGFGNVIDVVDSGVSNTPKVAITYSSADGTSMTVKDLRYKRNFCEVCYPHIHQAVLPFENSAQATYDYLRWVTHRLDGKNDLPDDW